MPLPTPMSLPYTHLIADIEQGKITIPQFQRKFVWSVEKTAELMDSIFKGYPIGAFIFWKSKERFLVVRSLGGANFPLPPDGESVNYVLDGQQRLSSIYACVTGAKIKTAVKTADYANIFVDLAASPDDGDVVVLENNKPSCISIADLVNGGSGMLARRYPEYTEQADMYKHNLGCYLFSVIQYENADISVATDIFTRINVGGKPLTLLEVMAAKTYDAKRGFDLSEKWKQLTVELGDWKYETISPETALQTVSVILSKDGSCGKKTILGLPKAGFIDGWNDAVPAVKSAIDYFRTEYRIPVSHLLPYSAMLVPFAYFFHKNGNKPISAEQQKYLCDFFWRCALSERYSSALESKLGQDVKKMDGILRGELPSYEEVLSLDPEWLMKNGHFRAGRSFVKAILCLYAAAEPQSFASATGRKVILGNEYLQRANRKNYHHFFPSDYLKKQGVKEERINHVLNITMVEEFLNKGRIGANPPSVYINDFRANNNPNIEATMRTHLIGDLDEFGVWTDDYDTFLAKRAERVLAEIKKRVILPTKG